MHEKKSDLHGASFGSSLNGLEAQPFYGSFIGGEWRTGGAEYDLKSPATGECVVRLPCAAHHETMEAVDAARSAFSVWRKRSASERAIVLKSAADTIRKEIETLARITSIESGKPLIEARGEWGVAANLFDFFAEEGKRVSGELISNPTPNRQIQAVYEPVGVVGVITAWNFPAYNPARAWAAALAAGCTVVAKPSEYTPLSALHLASILSRSGLTPGALNVIAGDAAAIGQALMESPVCRKISFTGSQRVGKLLMDQGSATMKSFNLELGGNAPVIVCADVDVPSTARGAVSSKFRNAGQVCVAPQRFLVHESIHDEFVRHVVESVAKLQVGPGLDPQNTLGPLINERQRENTEAMIRDAVQKGATVAYGGERPAHLTGGFFLTPTVLTGVTEEMRVFQEEIFGPVMPIARFSSFDEALRIANSRDEGLAGYVWSRDLTTAAKLAGELEVGMVAVNGWVPHATEAPFIGRKQSGLGVESGRDGLLGYMEKKIISLYGMG
jgi:succinate-semialdehyde dehydrogenase/glutarate-semialdehyde dehydrogenase